MSWEEDSLGTVAQIFSGFAFKSADLNDNPGIPVVKIANIQNRKVNKKCISYLPIDKFSAKLSKYYLCKDDILIAMTGQGSVGKIGKMINQESDYLINQRVGIIRVDKSKADPVFIYQIISNPFTENKYFNLAMGSGQPNLSPAQIASLRIPLPPLQVQRSIASILSAYDDLIENNRRRIQLLEQAARLLYREWFVHLRFPGHEHVTIIDGVPEGWEAVRLQDITSVVTKGTTPTSLGKAFTDEGINFIKVESVEENGGLLDSKFAHIDESTHNLLRRSQLYEGDILFSIAGAIGRSALVPACMLPANTNQALAIIRVRDPELRVFLFLTVRSAQFQNYSLGRVVQTAQKNVSLTALKEARVIMPNKTIMVAFLQQAGELQSMLWTLREQNNKLVKARDLLLPRLMNGEVAV